MHKIDHEPLSQSTAFHKVLKRMIVDTIVINKIERLLIVVTRLLPKTENETVDTNC